MLIRLVSNRFLLPETQSTGVLAILLTNAVLIKSLNVLRPLPPIDSKKWDRDLSNKVEAVPFPIPTLVFRFAELTRSLVVVIVKLFLVILRVDVISFE